jgi:hypothetical protein
VSADESADAEEMIVGNSTLEILGSISVICCARALQVTNHLPKMVAMALELFLRYDSLAVSQCIPGRLPGNQRAAL